MFLPRKKLSTDVTKFKSIAVSFLYKLTREERQGGGETEREREGETRKEISRQIDREREGVAAENERELQRGIYMYIC